MALKNAVSNNKRLSELPVLDIVSGMHIIASNLAAWQGCARLSCLEPRTISGGVVPFPIAQANLYPAPAEPFPDQYVAKFPS